MFNRLGQQTGHQSVNDAKREIIKLLEIIEVEKIEKEADKGFVISMRRSMGMSLWKPSGKQIFRLREIKDSQL